MTETSAVQNPVRTESPAVHITHATTYATLALLAQSLVTLGLPYIGLKLPPVVIAAVISLLIGASTVALHMAGIAVPGAPIDNGQDQMRSALRTLLQNEGPAIMDYLMREQPAARSEPTVAEAASPAPEKPAAARPLGAGTTPPAVPPAT